MKLAIVGSRNITKIDIASHINVQPTLIISGGAKGVDSIAANYAHANNIELLVIKPDYKAHRQGAPIRRNEAIVLKCDQVLAFWDGKSRGTKYTIDFAQKHNKKVDVVMCC